MFTGSACFFRICFLGYQGRWRRVELDISDSPSVLGRMPGVGDRPAVLAPRSV
jgi:hypothetical protein